MLITVLTTSVIVIGLLIYYIFFIVPKLNPSMRADSFIQQDMLEEAALELKKILDKNPYDFAAHYKLSEIYLKQEQFDLAVQHLEKIIQINKFSYEVNKNDVLKRLAQVYQTLNETEKSFQAYVDILKTNPSDPDALYQTAFISLAHGYFDMAQRYFDKLAPLKKDNFEVQFGAGMTSYQNQKAAEAVAYFKDALAVNPQSDIANLAMAFAQFKRRDFKTAINYTQMVIQNNNDPDGSFVAKRLQGILHVLVKKADMAVKVFEELLNYAKQNDLVDETSMILYDLGFASLSSEKTAQAYEYWNQLFAIDRGYKDVQKLIMILRKEMDETEKKGPPDMSESVFDYIDKWSKNAFPEDFVYNICGLKSNQELDLGNIVVTARVSSGKESSAAEPKKRIPVNLENAIDAFCDLDVENFRIIANRVVGKLGYKVDEILNTYRESDGVDFMAHSTKDTSKTLVWVRRWKGTKVGEIPLRNFAQDINDAKAKQGLFVTVSDLTATGEDALRRLSKVKVVYPDELASILTSVL